MSLYGFPKCEHLVLQRDIDALFSASGHSMAAFPVRAVWMLSEWGGKGPRVKVMVSVSKRKFKHAVDRNRAKRQMREAYRLNKHIVDAGSCMPEGKELHIAFIWISDTPQKSEVVHRRIVNLMQRISEKIHTMKAAVPSTGQADDTLLQMTVR